MMEKLRQLLGVHSGPGAGAQGDEARELQLATATLLMEVARADDCITGGERRDIGRLIEKHFGLDRYHFDVRVVHRGTRRHLPQTDPIGKYLSTD